MGARDHVDDAHHTRDSGAVGDPVGQRYAAHRLELVRLAVLLVGDRDVADAVVQAAFVRTLRDRAARAEQERGGAGLTALRSLVVTACRPAVRRAPPDRLDPLAGLGPAQREALVLTVWAGLTVRQAAVVLHTRDRDVERRLARLRTEPDEAQTTPEEAAEILRRRADRVTAADLRGTWASVLAEDAHRSARTRRGWRTALGAVAALAAVAAVTTLVGGRTTTPIPGPVTDATTSSSSAAVADSEPLSSPALAPGEQPRSAIPWPEVGPGWAVVATSAPPTAVTTTLLLVSPTGQRYPLGTAPDSIVLQDVSPDGRRVLVAVGAQAAEWDLEAGTSRPLGVSYGWKTMRYAGTPDRGYLVLWTASDSSVQVDHWSTAGRLAAEYPVTLPPTAGSPGIPGVVVDPAGRQAVVAVRAGGIVSIDLGLDAVGALPLPAGATGCAPRSSWAPAQVLLSCSDGGGRLLVAPLDGSVAQRLGGDGLAGAWPVSAQAAVVQQDDACSTRLATLNAGGGLTPWAPPAGAGGLVPNTVVAGVLYLGGTRCPTDGDRLVAYDLASGRTTELTGQDAGGRTVRQAVVLPARG